MSARMTPGSKKRLKIVADGLMRLVHGDHPSAVASLLLIDAQRDLLTVQSDLLFREPELEAQARARKALKGESR